MLESKRLRGLEILKSIRAPVPNWQLAKGLTDLNNLILPEASLGWTARSCRTDSTREVGLFFINYASREELIDVLRVRLGRNSPQEFYIIYPSWHFLFSCNVLLENHIYTLEGSYGSQKEITLGKSAGDFGFKIPFGFRSQLHTYNGKLDPLVANVLGRILNYCSRIPHDSFSAEVAFTTNRRLIFYELFVNKTLGGHGADF